MKVITPGHLYELDSMEELNPQQIQFIEKKSAKELGMDLSIYNQNEFITVKDGTTNEEVLAMLIDRCRTLYNKLPSKETAEAIFHLEEALRWFNERTKTRMAQGVENTPLPHK